MGTSCDVSFMQPPDISKLVQDLVDANSGGPTGLAAKLGVSASTVSRWLAGKSRPRPSVEGKLRRLARSLYSSSVQEPLPIGYWYEPNREDRLRTIIATTLQELREIFHRSGTLSSRHEALDEISKLFFAHTISLQTGGLGISSALSLGSQSPAKSLRTFAHKIFEKIYQFHLRMNSIRAILNYVSRYLRTLSLERLSIVFLAFPAQSSRLCSPGLTALIS